MMNFKNDVWVGVREGFTLLETLVAITIVGSAIAILFIMQSAVVRDAVRISERMRRIFVMESFLQEARTKVPSDTTEFKFEKQMSNPPTQLRYHLTKPSKQSPLGSKKGMCLERVTATWERFGERFNETLVTARYIPIPPKASL